MSVEAPVSPQVGNRVESRISFLFVLRWLWKYQRTFWVPFILAILLLGANLVLDIGLGLLQKTFFAQMRPGHMHTLITLVWVCGVSGIGLIALSGIQHYLRQFSQAYAGRDFALSVFDKVFRIPYQRILSYHSADIVSRISNDTGIANNLLSALVYDVGYQIVVGSTAFYFLARIQLGVALLAVLSGPILFLIGRVFDGRIRRITENIQKSDAGVRAGVQEALQGMQAVRAYGMEEERLLLFQEKRVAQNRLILRRTAMQSGMWQLVTMAQISAQIFCAILLARGAISGHITPGMMITFIFLMSNVQNPFMQMAQVWNGIQQSLGASRRLVELINLEDEPSAPANTNRATGTLSTGKLSTDSLSTGNLSTGNLSTGNLSTGNLSTGNLSTGKLSTGKLSTDSLSDLSVIDRGVPSDSAARDTSIGGGPEAAVPAIDFRGVCYSPLRGKGEPSDTDAPSSTLFEDLSLRIQPGETVAIVGPSGAGKSSVARLCCGIYLPDKGDVSIFGHSTRSDLACARKWISYVPQLPYVFSGTVRENIAIGLEDLPDADIEAAAKAASADEFITRLEQGYDTLVGEQGYKLSGGQRQRLAIARAILRKAPIIILDEPTSALDNDTEKAVQSALEALGKESTLLIIAHRLSTIRNASRILVMDSGRIVEEGVHADLINKGGLYARLVELQTTS